MQIAPEQLTDMSVPWVILGHSERRSLLEEGNDFVGAKAANALTHGLKVIACIGETLEQRETGHVCSTDSLPLLSGFCRATSAHQLEQRLHARPCAVGACSLCDAWAQSLWWIENPILLQCRDVISEADGHCCREGFTSLFSGDAHHDSQSAFRLMQPVHAADV